MTAPQLAESPARTIGSPATRTVGEVGLMTWRPWIGQERRAPRMHTSLPPDLTVALGPGMETDPP
jgi:hypothetical protein